jgi:hypothetical protein
LGRDGGRGQSGQVDTPAHRDAAARQLRVPARDEQEQRLVGDRPGQVLQEQQGRLVGRVHVLQDDDDGLVAGRPAEQPGDRVELAEPLLG